MLPAFEEVKANMINISFINEKEESFTFNIHYNSDSKPPKWEDDSISFQQFLSYVREELKEEPRLAKLLQLVGRMEKDKGADTVVNIRLRKNEEGGITIMPPDIELNQFLIYSLEETKLREPNISNRLYPLGRHGEGLFAYLKDLSQKPEGEVVFNEIKENLKVLDWFDDMEVPTGQLSMEFDLKLKDSYLPELHSFDQRSTNEGFLYLLFYLTLVISEETPKFFAIENIDTAFNPKLCREVTRRLIELARKHDKQIIATTHNAAVLDGMYLFEDDVRLHVVRRSIDGYTKSNRVTLKSEMSMPLSEAWVKGFIGGLPDNF